MSLNLQRWQAEEDKCRRGSGGEASKASLRFQEHPPPFSIVNVFSIVSV